MRSRNVLKFNSGATAADTTFVGAVNIEAVWKSFGTTEHDFESFTIAMTSYTVSFKTFFHSAFNRNLFPVLQPQMVVVTVNGMFKEHGQSLNEDEMLFAFVRTFVLVQSETNQGLRGLSVCYKISNEQVLIYRPSMLQIKNAFPTSNRASAISETTQVSIANVFFILFSKY